MLVSKPRDNASDTKNPLGELPVLSRSESVLWYAMRATYRRELDAMHRLKEAGMGCFIPMQYHFRLKRGRRVRELVPAAQFAFCACFAIRAEAYEAGASLSPVYYGYA